MTATKSGQSAETVRHPRPYGWTQALHELLQRRPELAGVGITALPIWGQA